MIDINFLSKKSFKTAAIGAGFLGLFLVLGLTVTRVSDLRTVLQRSRAAGYTCYAIICDAYSRCVCTPQAKTSLCANAGGEYSSMRACYTACGSACACEATKAVLLVSPPSVPSGQTFYSEMYETYSTAYGQTNILIQGNVEGAVPGSCTSTKTFPGNCGKGLAEDCYLTRTSCTAGTQTGSFEVSSVVENNLTGRPICQLMTAFNVTGAGTTCSSIGASTKPTITIAPILGSVGTTVTGTCNVSDGYVTFYDNGTVLKSAVQGSSSYTFNSPGTFQVACTCVSGHTAGNESGVTNITISGGGTGNYSCSELGSNSPVSRTQSGGGWDENATYAYNSTVNLGCLYNGPRGALAVDNALMTVFRGATGDVLFTKQAGISPWQPADAGSYRLQCECGYPSSGYGETYFTIQPSSGGSCKTDQVYLNLEPNKTTYNPGDQITFRVSGDPVGMLNIGDSWTAGAVGGSGCNCTQAWNGDYLCHVDSSGGRTCTAGSTSGTYYWTHVWSYGDPTNSAEQCQKTKAFQIAAVPQYHFECQSNSCVQVSGSGSNTGGCSGAGGSCCTAGSCPTGKTCSIATSPYSCVCASGTTACGTNCCSSGQTCSNGTCVTPTTYYSCQNGTCAVAAGATSNANGCTSASGQCCTSTSCPTGKVCDTNVNPNVCACANGTTACGTACCSSNQTCNNGACVDNYVCNSTTCPTGCCKNNVCQQPSANANCGVYGAACDVCEVNESCVAGWCTPITCNQTPPVCKRYVLSNGTCVLENLTNGTACSGGTCQNGTCVSNYVCGSTTCPSGCCAGNICVPFANQLTSSCGTGGAVCAACASGKICSVIGVCQGASQADACWGNNGTDGRCLDCNGDGVINVLDFSCFRVRYGRSVQ